MSTNAVKIDRWRAENPGVRLDASILWEVIGRDTLEGADLRCADLSYANLTDVNLSYANLSCADLSYANLSCADLSYASLRVANLRGADLTYANLRGADLRGADLTCADLWGANLRGADLSYANLWRARGDLLQIAVGLPSGPLTCCPTPEGWRLGVGCWRGTPDDLRTLIASDEAWPEARGREVARRRPYLEAALALVELHMRDHADDLAAVVQRWGGEDTGGDEG